MTAERMNRNLFFFVGVCLVAPLFSQSNTNSNLTKEETYPVRIILEARPDAKFYQVEWLENDEINGQADAPPEQSLREKVTRTEIKTDLPVRFKYFRLRSAYRDDLFGPWGQVVEIPRHQKAATKTDKDKNTEEKLTPEAEKKRKTQEVFADQQQTVFALANEPGGSLFAVDYQRKTLKITFFFPKNRYPCRAGKIDSARFVHALRGQVFWQLHHVKSGERDTVKLFGKLHPQPALLIGEQSGYILFRQCGFWPQAPERRETLPVETGQPAPGTHPHEAFRVVCQTGRVVAWQPLSGGKADELSSILPPCWGHPQEERAAHCAACPPSAGA